MAADQSLQICKIVSRMYAVARQSDTQNMPVTIGPVEIVQHSWRFAILLAIVAPSGRARLGGLSNLGGSRDFAGYLIRSFTLPNTHGVSMETAIRLMQAGPTS